MPRGRRGGRRARVPSCKDCGRTIVETWNYCPHCGARTPDK